MGASDALEDAMTSTARSSSRFADNNLVADIKSFEHFYKPPIAQAQVHTLGDSALPVRIEHIHSDVILTIASLVFQIVFAVAGIGISSCSARLSCRDLFRTIAQRCVRQAYSVFTLGS